MSAPLIVTARLDDAGFALLDGLRRRHFPPALNRIPAHISLFHALPGDDLDGIATTIREVCRPLRPFDLTPLAPRSLGRGVALAYASGDLDKLHAALATAWRVWLTPQDRQPFKAHVTIQNKVDPAEARELLGALAGVPLPACRIEGISLWRYLDGPWAPIGTFPFGAGRAARPGQ